MNLESVIADIRKQFVQQDARRVRPLLVEALQERVITTHEYTKLYQLAAIIFDSTFSQGRKAVESAEAILDAILEDRKENA